MRWPLSKIVGAPALTSISQFTTTRVQFTQIEGVEQVEKGCMEHFADRARSRGGGGEGCHCVREGGILGHGDVGLNNAN